MLKPRHPLIARWIVREIATISLKEEAIRLILEQVSSEIIPDEIRKRSDPYLTYRGLINYDYVYATLGHDIKKVYNIYDVLQNCYSNDFLFWLQHARAYAAEGLYDTAENYVNCEPTAHRFVFSDSASLRFCRLGPTAHRFDWWQRQLLFATLGARSLPFLRCLRPCR